MNARDAADVLAEVRRVGAHGVIAIQLSDEECAALDLAIASLRAAGEPVAWRISLRLANGATSSYVTAHEPHYDELPPEATVTPLYAAAPPSDAPGEAIAGFAEYATELRRTSPEACAALGAQLRSQAASPSPAEQPRQAVTFDASKPPRYTPDRFGSATDPRAKASPAEQGAREDSLRAKVADLFGIGSEARTDTVILTNLENTLHRIACLDAMERELFTVPTGAEPWDEETPESECLVNSWGSTPAEYVEQVRSAGAGLPAPPLAAGRVGVAERTADVAMLNGYFLAGWNVDYEELVVAWQRVSHALAGPLVAGEVERAEWMACESRAPWASNSLKRSAGDMRQSEKRCRNAFKQDWMGEPARYVADAYGEAAAAFERRLAAMRPLVYADTAKGNGNG